MTGRLGLNHPDGSLLLRGKSRSTNPVAMSGGAKVDAISTGTNISWVNCHLIVGVPDHHGANWTSRPAFKPDGQNKYCPEIELLVRHFGQVQILDLVYTRLREVVMVNAKRQPGIVTLLPRRHGWERPNPRLVYRGVGEWIV